MFLQQGYPLEASFTDGLEQNFGVIPESVDFQSPGGTEAINAWVAQQTHGLIPRIVEALPPETRLAVANAIYLKARWSERFKPRNSAQAPFHGETGTTSTVFMHKIERLPYTRGRGYAATALPYADSTLSLLVVLPVRQSLQSLERQLQPSALDRIVRGLSKRAVRVGCCSFPPPDPSCVPPAGGEFIRPFSCAAVAGSVTDELRVVCSDNDPYNPTGAVGMYAEPLRCPVDVLEGAGHITPASGYGAWPSLESWCLGRTTSLVTEDLDHA